ncbi:MAG: oligosaccharide flippase family protein [Melioribacteraceae bacterium]|nr:oligosaccharide flippase family protein [Melioribacteraceae bacterium]MCF8264209.1 oligosaccharide flippase family protein [Melioribacteraceae bacterium]MCF8412179.1 oligosaccharide flippase family protein [Melioribacteraceae bacterium]
MQKKHFLNSFSGVVQLILSTLLIFITIPIFRNELGHEQYSLFALIMVLGNFSVFVDLGLSSVLVKYLSEQGQSQESNDDIITSLINLMIIVLPITILAIIYSNFIMNSILNIPPNQIGNIIDFYIFILISNGFMILGQVTRAVLDSLHLIFIVNNLQSLLNILYWGGILVVVITGGNLNLIGLAIFIATILWFSLQVYYVLKYWGKFNLETISLRYIKSSRKQFTYSLKIYTSSTIGFFVEPFSKLLLSNFIGLDYVGYFDIVLRIKNQIWRLFYKLIYPVYPIIANLKEKDRLVNVISVTQRVLILILLPSLILLIIVSPAFIQLWIGAEVNLISWSIILLVTATAPALVTVPIYFFLISKDLASKTIYLQLVNVLVNIVLFFVLKEHLNYFAIILSNSLALFSSFGLIIHYQKRFLGTYTIIDRRDFFSLLKVGLILLFVGYLVSYLFEAPILRIISTTLVLAISTIVLVKYFNLVKSKDIDSIISSEAKLNHLLKKNLIQKN